MHNMHNDEPVLIDGLKRGTLVQEVADAIANCEPPQVFGVHGDWGLGKTSFLHQVQWNLAGECPQLTKSAATKVPKSVRDTRNMRVVWFDAWRYQHEDVPVVALLQEMRKQLPRRRQVLNQAGRLANVATQGALLSMESLTKQIGFQFSKVVQASRQWETENFASPLPSYALRELLQANVCQLLKPAKKLVVFIDDLDRCQPQVAYRLLEGLKIYLTLDNCVFVLGMNQRTIEAAIATQMSDDAPWRAAAYMEKICQNVWRLPSVQQPSCFFGTLIEKTVADGTAQEWLNSVAGKSECLPPNPRRIKGLANLVGRLSSLLPRPTDKGAKRGGIFEAKLLLVVAYVYQFHHDLYVRWQVNPDLYTSILAWCEVGSTNIDILKQMSLPRVSPHDSAKGDEAEGRTAAEVGRRTADLEPAFPDPTAANVFWIQPLVLSLGTEATPKSFKPYLHGMPP